jgi:hypothetical protein
MQDKKIKSVFCSNRASSLSGACRWQDVAFAFPHRGVRSKHLFWATYSRIAEMDSTAETGTKIEIPEGSLISMETLVESDVCTRRKAVA